MMNMRKYVFALLIAVASFAACSKKKSAPPVPAPPPATDSTYLSMSVGSNFHFTTDSATISIISFPNDSGRANATISASQTIAGIGYSISLYITNFTGINSYVIAPPQVSATYYANGVRHFAQSGQIIIATDSNNVLIGSFNFMADSLTVTNGVFNVQL